jgi:hypothetical protein
VADTTSTLILAATSAVAATLPNPIAQDVLFVDATYDIGKSGASRPRDLFQSRNATIGGTLGVTGATTLSSTVATGALTVTGNETVSGTLGVTGATTLSSTVATGALTVTGNETVSGTLGVTGAATLSSTVATGALTVTGNETVSGTLGVTGATSLSSATVSSTLGVTGAATLSSTLAVTGATTLTGGLNTPLVVAQGGSGVATHTAYGVIVGGTTATGATQTITPGTSGYLLTSGGASAVPTWAAASSGLSQSFRGLSLRTSPDANLAATTVTMLNCDNIVCSDGVQRTPADNLAATITTSGINGLRASQAEAASTWYKIMYAYGGSGEGLYLEQAKDFFLDESALVNNGTYTGIRYNTNLDEVGQQFTVSTSGPLPFLDLMLQKVLSPTGYIKIAIYADSGGLPTGAALATSDNIDVSLISTTAQLIRFPFRSPYSLTAGTVYHFVTISTSAVSASNYIQVIRDTTGGYANGTLEQRNDAGTWSEVAGNCLYFRIYITRNDNAVTPPTGYNTGYAQIGWVRNDGSSNFLPFNALDKSSIYLAGQTVISAGAATVATLTDISAWMPPISVTTMWVTRGSVAGTDVVLGGVPDGYGLQSFGVVGDFGMSFNDAPVDNYYFTPQPVQTEFQAVYYYVSAGSARWVIKGWSW